MRSSNNTSVNFTNGSKIYFYDLLLYLLRKLIELGVVATVGLGWMRTLLLGQYSPKMFFYPFSSITRMPPVSTSEAQPAWR